MALPRIITAVLLGPIVISIIWVGSFPYAMFVLAVALLSFWEYANMAEGGGYPNQLILGMLGVFFIVMALFLDGAIPLGPIHRNPNPIFILMVWTFASFMREFSRPDKGHSLLRIVTTFFGIVLCGLFLGHLMLLREIRMVAGEGYKVVGREIVFFLIFITWTHDVGAWLVGNLTKGTLQIAPTISPGKRLQGSVGGGVLACLMGWILQQTMLRNTFGPFEAVYFAFCINMAGEFSDLIESLIKRSFGFKDSSSLLPGHGGILDRFDSYIFAAPIFYYLLLISGRFQ